jgi:NAD(P)-dependent dehydrogenase (short-subunit alcohol dehydrogenase family)
MVPGTPRRAVLVTGASSGIGAACAIRLARRGFFVFAGVRDDAAAERWRRCGAAIEPIRLDVTNACQIAAALQHITGAVESAGLAGLVNNAGIAVATPLETVPLAEFRRQLEVNVVGAIAVTQACLPLLRRGRGRIVNMGSIAGRHALPVLGPYSASKHALAALTDALRLEVRQFGMHASLIEPGAIATPIWGKSISSAEILGEAASPEIRGLYSHIITRIGELAADGERHAIAPDRVAAAVEHALTARRPRPRYLVGRDARLRAALQWLLPLRWHDAIVRRVVGI